MVCLYLLCGRYIVKELMAFTVESLMSKDRGRGSVGETVKLNNLENLLGVEYVSIF